MATTSGGSSPPLRSYRDAVAGAAARPPPPPVSFDTASFRPMGMLTRDQGMKVLRFSSEEIARLSQPFRYALVGKFSHGYPSMQHLRRWMLAQGFRGDFSVGAINARHVFIKFALEEDYTKLWIKSIWFVDGFPMRVFKWTPTFNPREESPIVPVWVRLPELPIQFFDREALFSIAVVYERLPKYCATCKHLGHDEDECYEKIKNRGPVRPVEGEDQRASRADLREKLEAQRAQRELHTRRKGKRVMFEDVDRRPEASSSGAKGAEDSSVAMKLQDTVHEPEPVPAPEPEPQTNPGPQTDPGPQTEPEPLFHDEAVQSPPNGGTEKDMPILQSPPDVCQGNADEDTCPLEPAVPEEPLHQDDSPVCVEPHLDTEDVALCLSGESTLQSDTEDVTKCLARHRRGRSLGDEPEAHSASPDRGKVRGWKCSYTADSESGSKAAASLGFPSHHGAYGSLDGRFMARRLGFLDVVSNCGNQIWVFWGPDVRCQVLVDHEQLLHIRLESNKWPKPLFVTVVYAKCDTVERRAFWDALRAVSVDCALVDAGYVGSPYTWYSRRLRQRLDRVLISSCWMTVFPKMQVAHLELSQSDHRGLLVEAECSVERKVSSFRFQHMWTTHSEFLGVVCRNWRYPTVGSERGLKEADEAYDQEPCDRTLVERNRCSAELVRVLAQEETFWRQKAGIRWAKDGERNTRYFHSLDSAASFFQRLLTAEPVFRRRMDSEHLEDGLTDEDRRFLCVMPTLEEVREAVFSIDPDSVAGPDGFGGSLFSYLLGDHCRGCFRRSD
ncbi:UNVERIFIED_CONTAM: hypothetical protein Sangu_3235100 [Sesamum angustifolium]|uniref:DUF4283 domain-containing protein n=1 Tax=Sesamum angustifolium TaxID=2727405 RepID=A0AAW2JH83_9LAMI